MPKHLSAAVLLALALSASSALAVTYLVPPDAELVAAAPAIVVAHAVTSHAQLTPAGAAVTVTQLAVDEVLKGDVAAGTTVEVMDPGGIVGNFATVIPGSPRYEDGAQYLVFLGRNQLGEWGTFAMGLGKFRFVEDLTGRAIVLRGEEGAIDGYSKTDWTPHVEQLRDAESFLTFIRTVVCSGAAAARTDYLVDRQDVVLAGFTHPIAANFRAAATAARTDYLDSNHLRWRTPTTTVYYCCQSKSYQGSGSTLNAVSAFTTALGRWNGAGAGVNYSNGGNNENATGGLTGASGRTHHDGINAVLFGDPFGDLPNPGGGSFLLGLGGGNGWSYTGPDGLTYFGPDVTGGNPAGEIDVIMNDAVDPVGQIRFNAAVTHELGHTLGFRHSDKSPDDSSACALPLPCASTAIMNSFINQDYTGLQQWDRDAVNTVYGSGQTCTAPAISTQPTGSTITQGQQASLTIGATGTATLTYQWYVGTAPNTSSPVPSGTGATLLISPSSTTTYWVQVTNSCGTANSNSATVTVNGSCTQPSISTQPTGSTIAQGQQASLTVGASGSTPFTYQWYVGAPPSTSNPVPGGTNATVLVSPSTTTSYWVQVTNACGTANSNSATVTVTGGTCTPSSISTQPSGSTITQGQQTALSVGASGSAPFSYQWYVGSPPSTANPLANATTASILVAPSSTTTYWVQVTNACGTANSNAATVTVNPAICVPPSITIDPADQTVTAGGTASLFVGYVGTAGIVTWYQGTKPDTSHQVGTGQTLQTPPLAATTQFWAQVTNGCGGAQTRTVSVTVVAACVPPSIGSVDAAPRSVTLGQPVTLTVQATGTSLTYQWYRGARGDITNPVPNATTPTATDTPLANTTYWARVTGGCGTPQDSTAIAVTVGPACIAPQITQVSPDARISSNTSVTLNVSAAGDALHYQWYRGAVDDVSTPVGADNATLLTPVLLADAQFWVKVTNGCGTAKSRAVQVTVVPARHRAVHH